MFSEPVGWQAPFAGSWYELHPKALRKSVVDVCQSGLSLPPGEPTSPSTAAQERPVTEVMKLQVGRLNKDSSRMDPCRPGGFCPPHSPDANLPLCPTRGRGLATTTTTTTGSCLSRGTTTTTTTTGSWLRRGTNATTTTTALDPKEIPTQEVHISADAVLWQ